MNEDDVARAINLMAKKFQNLRKQVTELTSQVLLLEGKCNCQVIPDVQTPSKPEIDFSLLEDEELKVASGDPIPNVTNFTNKFEIVKDAPKRKIPTEKQSVERFNGKEERIGFTEQVDV